MDKLMIEHVAKAIESAAKYPLGENRQFSGKIIYRANDTNAECEMLSGDWEMIAQSAIESVNSYKQSETDFVCDGVRKYGKIIDTPFPELPQVYASKTRGDNEP